MIGGKAGEELMKCLHIFTNEVGNSTIGEIEVSYVTPFANMPLKASKIYEATAGQLVHSAPCTQDWHPAPRRQLFVLLSGEVQFETSDGKTADVLPGSVILVNAMASKGHLARVKKVSRCLL